MVEKIIWKSEYDIGFDSIDAQHKQLVKIINELIDCSDTSGDSKTLQKILNDLLDYIKFHFGFEESYFRKYNYPGSQAHLKEHNQFTNKIQHFISEFKKRESGFSGIISLLAMYLQNWLIQHIQGTDRDYIDFFKEYGMD